MKSSSGLEVLKVDIKGRVRIPRERREALLAEYDRCGMSAAGFAEWTGVKYPTLMWWLQQRRREQEKAGRSETGQTSTKWVEAIVENVNGESAGGAGRLVIEIGAARMEVSDRPGAALAAEVLRQLGAGGGC